MSFLYFPQSLHGFTICTIAIAMCVPSTELLVNHSLTKLKISYATQPGVNKLDTYTVSFAFLLVSKFAVPTDDQYD